jgi:hypothetical protein
MPPDPHDLAKDAVIARLLDGWLAAPPDRWIKHGPAGYPEYDQGEPMTDREADIVRAALAELSGAR